jgi:hypothetical protein
MSVSNCKHRELFERKLIQDHGNWFDPKTEGQLFIVAATANEAWGDLLLLSGVHR